jgi:hypothetical protein
MKGIPSFSCMSIAVLLTACTPADEQLAQLPVEAAEPNLAAEPVTTSTAAVFDTATTLRDLMNKLIDPSAQNIWQAVSYVVTDKGVSESQPETTEDWERLRTSALALIEAGNALMLPGRQVDLPQNSADYPDYQYRPDEIAALIAIDPDSWNRYAQDMQLLTRDTLTAIGFRDLMGLSDFGARINEACQDCHAQFWYRPLESQGQ